MNKRAQERGRKLITFELEPDWHDRLKKIAKREERKISPLIRYIVKEYVKFKEQEMESNGPVPTI